MADEVVTLKLEEMLANPDEALARGRNAGAVVATELGSMAMRHEAVRTMLREPRLRPSFSNFLEQLGITSGAFYDWMSGSPLLEPGATFMPPFGISGPTTLPISFAQRTASA
jgi:hypothetical protein